MDSLLNKRENNKSGRISNKREREREKLFQNKPIAPLYLSCIVEKGFSSCFAPPLNLVQNVWFSLILIPSLLFICCFYYKSIKLISI